MQELNTEATTTTAIPEAANIPREELSAFVEEAGGRVATEEETEQVEAAVAEKKAEADAAALSEAEIQQLIANAQMKAMGGQRLRTRGPGTTRPVFKQKKARAKGKAAKLARRNNR